MLSDNHQVFYQLYQNEMFKHKRNHKQYYKVIENIL